MCFYLMFELFKDRSSLDVEPNGTCAVTGLPRFLGLYRTMIGYHVHGEGVNILGSIALFLADSEK